MHAGVSEEGPCSDLGPRSKLPVPPTKIKTKADSVSQAVVGKLSFIMSLDVEWDS